MKTLIKKIKPIAMGLFIAALAVGISAFSKMNASRNAADAMYWYDTNDAGTVLSNPDQVLITDSPSLIPPCEGNSALFCARGFKLEETKVDGIHRRPNIAIEDGLEAEKPAQ